MQKKLMLIILVSVITKLSVAQVFGFNAGLVLSSYKVKANDVSATSDIKAGFAVGVVSSFRISKYFSFRPELNFVRKGGVLKDGAEGVKNSATYNYLELPLNFVYHTLPKKGDLFIGGGPALGVGLSGKYKITGMYEESGDIHFGGGGNADLKSLEVSINLLAGYQFKGGLTASAVYNFGVNNISQDHDLTFHNRYYMIRLGYMFGK